MSQIRIGDIFSHKGHRMVVTHICKKTERAETASFTDRYNGIVFHAIDELYNFEFLGNLYMLKG